MAATNLIRIQKSFMHYGRSLSSSSRHAPANSPISINFRLANTLLKFGCWTKETSRRSWCRHTIVEDLGEEISAPPNPPGEQALWQACLLPRARITLCSHTDDCRDSRRGRRGASRKGSAALGFAVWRDCWLQSRARYGSDFGSTPVQCTGVFVLET